MPVSICVGLNDNGFFVNFNQVVDWLAFGDRHGISVGVNWRIEKTGDGWDFNYGGFGKNVWTSYFEPLPCVEPESLAVNRPWTPYLGGFRGFRLYKRLEADSANSTRRRLHAALNSKVRLLPVLQSRIDDFGSQFCGLTMIGVHLRNPAGSRGYYYSRFPEMKIVVRAIERVVSGLASDRDWRIFAASDRDGMIDALVERFPGRVIWQSGITRAPAEGGYEVHSVSPPSHELGVQVISDCWLLSKCNHLIGVQSSVCLAACIINPALKFHYARSLWTRVAGEIEYMIKSAWCTIFEPVHQQIVDARHLIRL